MLTSIMSVVKSKRFPSLRHALRSSAGILSTYLDSKTRMLRPVSFKRTYASVEKTYKQTCLKLDKKRFRKTSEYKILR